MIIKNLKKEINVNEIILRLLRHNLGRKEQVQRKMVVKNRERVEAISDHLIDEDTDEIGLGLSRHLHHLHHLHPHLRLLLHR